MVAQRCTGRGEAAIDFSESTSPPGEVFLIAPIALLDQLCNDSKRLRAKEDAIVAPLLPSLRELI
jgi:hypothetical protein